MELLDLVIKHMLDEVRGESDPRQLARGKGEMPSGERSDITLEIKRLAFVKYLADSGRIAG